MIKGEKVRFDIHNILFSIYKFNKTLNNPSIKKTIGKHKKEDVSLINNVALNSMRLHIHVLIRFKQVWKLVCNGSIPPGDPVFFLADNNKNAFSA